MQHSQRGGHRTQYGWGHENWQALSKHGVDEGYGERVPQELGPLASEVFFFEIEVGDLLDNAGITDVHFVASYTLTDGKDNKIIVPGKPAVWKPLPRALTLAEDTGNFFMDENAARFPQFPAEPTAHAILLLQPDFDTSCVDIVADSRSLDRLWRFAQGALDPLTDRFAFLVQNIGKTAFIVRREHRPDALIPDMRGYRHEYLENATYYEHDYKHSKSHQRIISYNLGGLKILVRYAVDCYDAAAKHTLHAETSPSTSTTATHGLITLGEDKSAMVIEPRGEQIAQKDIIDIKTRSDSKDAAIVMKAQLPRLWIRQITRSVLARHNRGLFQVPVVSGRTNEMKEWETDNNVSIARYAKLLDLIKQAASASKDGMIEVRCMRQSSLNIHALNRDEVGKWNALSEKMHKKWASE